MIERLTSHGMVPGPSTGAGQNVAKTGTFGELLRQRMESVGTAQPAAPKVEFSKHAQMRAEERGIEMSADLIDRLSDSAQLAQEKGARNILVFDASRAFIVNVPQNRVVTAISQDEMQNNIFTNIDGAVLLK